MLVMADEIVVNFPMLHRAAEDIGSALKRMNSELDDLKRGIQPMVSTWDGGAQNAYLSRQSEWERASQDLSVLLTQIQGAVVKSAEIMQAREKSNIAKFQ
jgi:6 kDa early secretory antigenic target